MSIVNIVMSTYNGEKYIAEQIDSIINSTYTNWSMLICDDHSTDNTINIINEYASKYSEQIFVYSNKINRGSTMNFLNGVRMLGELALNKQIDKEDIRNIKSTSIRAKYFMFCDQDDVWKKDKIERSLEYIEMLEKKHGTNVPALIFTDAEIADEKMRVTNNSFYKSSKLKVNKTDIQHLLMENKCIGCTIMFNLALAEYINIIPDGIRYHDWWVSLIASSFGYIGYLPLQTMKYRQHSSNQVGGTGFGNYVSNRFRTFGAQKEALLKTICQANAFYEIYKKELPAAVTKKLQIFINLEKQNWFIRRFNAIKYKFLKSGIIRNIGLMIRL